MITLHSAAQILMIRYIITSRFSCKVDPNSDCLKLQDRGVKILNEPDRISATEFSEISKNNAVPHVLIDVREPQEMEICSLPDVSMNVPYSQMYSDKSMDTLKRFVKERAKLAKAIQGADALHGNARF